MMNLRSATLAAITLLAASGACFFAFAADTSEPHLANIRQLTFGGENAEAYFSSDGSRLVLQSTREPYHCDQIFTMNPDGSGVKQISNGKGRTTCSYFLDGDQRILYSSTFAASPDCPPRPDYSKGYVWALYPSYDIYSSKTDGTDLKVLNASAGYDAEATVSPDGKKIVFTSTRDGDIELYSMNIDGTGVKRLTNEPGYDGGAFFSPDSKRIVFRADHIKDPKELEEYRQLLKENLIRPRNLEVFVMDADGKNMHQVTNNGAANFCPYFHPDGKRIIFASNVNGSFMNFDLYLINDDGTGLEKITSNPTFDAFPMFSPDGKKLVFASNRNQKVEGETNIFIADWVEHPAAASASAATASASVENLKKDVGTLASDEMKGRLTGTPEARKAAEYIEAEFVKYGLQPPPQTKSAYQQFEFISGVELTGENSLKVQTASGTSMYKVGTDFVPTGYSEDASLKDIPLVFAGFGIQAPDLKHDDYEGIDVKGKAVLIERYGPEGDDPKSQYATYYPLRYKAMTAREKGAAALLVLYKSDDKDEALPELKSDASFGTSGIPILYVQEDVAATWLKQAGKQLPAASDPKAERHFDVAGEKVSLECHLDRIKSKSDNVLGWLPAAAPTDQTIVIGAHYDHLGLGIEGSLAPKRGQIHNGADDNASGVAGILELARLLNTERDKLRRNVLFISFGGEELGALGSTYFVKNPILPLKNIVTMINLDMIGRLREDKLVISGTGTSPEFKDLLEKTAGTNFKLTLNEDGYGPSDQASFYAKDIPVLFFFTGSHAEYHRPEDKPATLNYEGLAKVVNYVLQITDAIETQPEAPKFTRVKGSAAAMGGRSFRVYLGTIPDFTENVKGVKLTGVREGSPAEKGGLQAGDVIVEFGGKKVENIYDYTYALQEHKAGDTVTVIVLRGDKRVPLQVTLEKREMKD